MRQPRRLVLTGSCVALGALHRSPPPFELPRNGRFARPAAPPSPAHPGAVKLEEGEFLVKPASAKALAAT
jgi:hypothetical protein